MHWTYVPLSQTRPLRSGPSPSCAHPRGDRAPVTRTETLELPRARRTHLLQRVRGRAVAADRHAHHVPVQVELGVVVGGAVLDVVAALLAALAHVVGEGRRHGQRLAGRESLSPAAEPPAPPVVPAPARPVRASVRGLVAVKETKSKVRHGATAVEESCVRNLPTYDLVLMALIASISASSCKLTALTGSGAGSAGLTTSESSFMGITMSVETTSALHAIITELTARALLLLYLAWVGPRKYDEFASFAMSPAPAAEGFLFTTTDAFFGTNSSSSWYTKAIERILNGGTMYPGRAG